MAFYTNPGGGYGYDKRGSTSPLAAFSSRLASGSNAFPLRRGESPVSLKASDWIQPRQDDLPSEDPWRASWENQRRGVAGRFNKKNRGVA